MRGQATYETSKLVLLKTSRKVTGYRAKDIFCVLQLDGTNVGLEAEGGLLIIPAMWILPELLAILCEMGLVYLFHLNSFRIFSVMMGIKGICRKRNRCHPIRTKTCLQIDE